MQIIKLGDPRRPVYVALVHALLVPVMDRTSYRNAGPTGDTHILRSEDLEFWNGGAGVVQT